MNSDRKKLVIRIFSILLIISIIISSVLSILYTIDDAKAEGSTEINGFISTDTTWTVANSPYIITAKSLVEEDVTLTIQPGVTIKFAGRTYLTVRGALIALGTESKMITFTSNEESPKPGDWMKIRFEETNMNSTFNYCIIEYSYYGIEGEGTWHNFVNISITNSKFLNNQARGIHLESSNSIISGNLFYNCNTGVVAAAGTYQIHHNYFIKNRNRGIDGSGGDTLIFKNNILMDNRGGIIVGSGSVLIKNNIIENNTSYGIYCAGGSPEILNNNIVNNANGIVIWASDTTLLIAHQNNIFGNSNYSVKVVYGKSDASYNWWGTIDTSIINEKIYDYYDDWDKGKVEYLPILESPVDVKLQDMLPVSELNLEQYDLDEPKEESDNDNEDFLRFEFIIAICVIVVALGLSFYIYRRKERGVK